MYLITLASILLITAGVYLFNRITKWNICPICAGVSGTWLWMFASFYSRSIVDPFIIAILMGGSVVGIMYMLDNRIPEGKNKLVFKTLFFLAGFSVVYFAINLELLKMAASIIVGALVSFYFLTSQLPHKDKSPRVAELEKKMEKCCE